MTRTHPRVPQMPLDDFEDLARGAPETVWLEFVRGRAAVKPPPDGDHSEILVSLLRQFVAEDRAWNLFPYAGLRTETSLAGRYLPDASLVRRDHRLGRSHWASPEHHHHPQRAQGRSLPTRRLVPLGDDRPAPLPGGRRVEHRKPQEVHGAEHHAMTEIPGRPERQHV